MHARVLALAELGPRDVRRWQALAHGALEPNPFYAPAFVQGAAACGAGPLLLVVQHGARWLACLPVEPRRRAPAFEAWRYPHCFLGTPLLAADRSADALEVLLREAMQARGGVLLRTFAAAGAVASSLRAAAAGLAVTRVVVRRSLRAALLPGEHDGPGRSGHHARELARLRRAAEAAYGDELVVVDRSADAGGLDRFLELETAGWKGRAGTALAGQVGDVSLLRSLFESRCSGCRLEMFALEAGRSTLAVALNLRGNRASFGFKIAHDPLASRFSPGIQLQRAIMDHYRSPDAMPWTWFDSCSGASDPTSLRLWPERRPVASELIAAAGVRGSVTRALARTLAARATRRTDWASEPDWIDARARWLAATGARPVLLARVAS